MTSPSPTPRPILAIVGRPNVGKSTLFNRIAGRRNAIVHEESGITRERVSAPARHNRKSFEVMDTGGIAFVEDEKTSDAIGAATTRQAEVAIDLADVIVMVVDVTAGVAPLDLEIAQRLRRSAKPVFLAINKVDNSRRERELDEFTRFGFRPLFPIAAAHGTGVFELLDAATAGFPETIESTEPPPLRIAIVGKPNAGKSSLINAIVASERTIVSEIPGTTRDSVDIPFALTVGDQTKSFVLVDTAGLRHRSKVASSAEQFSLMRAERSIRECDIAVLTMDAVAGVTKQDKRVGGLISEAGNGCVILVNKWDLAADEERKLQSVPAGRRAANLKPKTFRDEYLAAVRKQLFFLDWAPVLFASAKTGERLDQLFDLLARVEVAADYKIDTPKLNQMLGHSLDSYPPPRVGGKRLKIYYAIHRKSRPPTFALFVNHKECLTPHYARFLMNRIRAIWGFEGSPIRLELRERERRKFNPK